MIVIFISLSGITLFIKITYPSIVYALPFLCFPIQPSCHMFKFVAPFISFIGFWGSCPIPCLKAYYLPLCLCPHLHLLSCCPTLSERFQAYYTDPTRCWYKALHSIRRSLLRPFLFISIRFFFKLLVPFSSVRVIQMKCSIPTKPYVPPRPGNDILSSSDTPPSSFTFQQRFFFVHTLVCSSFRLSSTYYTADYLFSLRIWAFLRVFRHSVPSSFF